MNKRKSKCIINSEDSSIDLSLLSLEKYKEQVKIYSEMVNEAAKIDFLFNTLRIESKKINLFQENYLYFQNTQQSNFTNDLVKYCLQKLFNYVSEISDEDDKEIYVPQDIFLVLITEAYTSNDIKVRYISLEILIEFSHHSTNIAQYFYNKENPQEKYLLLLLNLSYYNNYGIVNNVFLLLSNVLSDLNNELEFILNEFPFVTRIKEIIYQDIQFELKKNLINIIEIIVNGLSNVSLYSQFADFILCFNSCIINNEIKDECLFESILKILSSISQDNEVIHQIMNSTISYHIIHFIQIKDLQSEYLNLLLAILSNLLFQDYAVTFYLNGGILPILDKILNTYKNTVNKKDNIIIKNCVFCLSNITGGTEEQVAQVMKTKIPQNLLQISKIRNSPMIDYEVYNFFYNIFIQGADQDVIQVIKMKSMKLFCEGLNKSTKIENVLICLKSIQMLFKRNYKIYNTITNLKNEYYGYCAKKNIDLLMNSKNEEVSKEATEINELVETAERKIEEDEDIN